MKRLVPALACLLAVAIAAAVGCQVPHDVPHEICQACITRDGWTGCGQVDVNLKAHPGVTEDQVKLRAGQAACKELAAHQGSGYAGPLFQKAYQACASKVTPKDLFRTRCDAQVRTETWQPSDGVDAY